MLVINLVLSLGLILLLITDLVFIKRVNKDLKIFKEKLDVYEEGLYDALKAIEELEKRK